MTTSDWIVETIRGTSSEVHAREVEADPGPTMWVVEPTDRSVVLGSTQSIDDVDRAEADRRGLAVARRRSGGGAVLVSPGDLLWVDVIVPRSHPGWFDDIGRAAVWMGEHWQRALASLGVETAVVPPPMASDPLARTVCFVGRGPGEVVVGDRKVVGVSQRRSRGWARFQCAALLAWDPDPLIAVMPSLTESDRDRVLQAGAGLPVVPTSLADALAASLSQT